MADMLDPAEGMPDDATPSEPAKPEGDAALISELTAKVEAPPFLTTAFKQMSSDREYVASECMLRSTNDAVAVNMILRNQIVGLAYLGVADPQPFVQPARTVGGVTSPVTERFAETMEVHLARQAKLMDFGRQVEGAAQDASTCAFAILKVTLQADYTRDPTGGPRFNDLQETAMEYLRLKSINPAPESADGQRLADIEETVRLNAATILAEQISAEPVLIPGMVPAADPLTGAPILNPMTGLPEMVPGMVPDPTDPREMQRQAIIDGKPFDLLSIPAVEHYLGFQCSQVQPDDYRWEWSATRPEDLPSVEWQADRTFMSLEAIQRKWGITDEEREAISVPPGPRSAPISNSEGGTGEALPPSVRIDLETTTVNNKIAVWEVYHRPSFRRYVFIPGMSRFLENTLVQNAGGRFFPYFMFYYNRVTGHVLPVSDVQLTRALQDEANMLRSHDREARRASYPVLFVPKGWLEPAALNLYRNRLPFSVIEVANPEAIREHLQESATVPYNPALFNTAAVESQMQAMFGIPQIAVGGAGTEDLASAVALSKEAMETGVARRRIQVNRVITDIFHYMAEISLKVFSEPYMKMLYGPEAVWPKLTAEQLYSQLSIEVKGGLSGQPRAKDRLDLWMNFANIAQSLGLPVNGIEVLKQLLDAMGIRVDFTRFLALAPVAPPAAAGSPEKPPGGQGPDGGAPHMVDPVRGAPDDLSQIPNHPPLPGAPV